MKNRGIVITIFIILIILIASFFIFSFNKTKLTGNVIFDSTNTLYSNLVNYYDFEGDFNDPLNDRLGTIYGEGTNSFEGAEGQKYLTIDNQYISLQRKVGQTITLANQPASSVSVWVKLSSLPGVQTIYGESNIDNIIYSLNINQGKPGLGIWNSGWKYVLSDTTLQPNTWYLITGTFGPSGLKIYINEDLSKSLQTEPGWTATGQIAAVYVGGQLELIRMGAGTNTNFEKRRINFLHGSLDDLMIFQKELSALEVKQIAINGRLGPSRTASRVTVIPTTTTDTILFEPLQKGTKIKCYTSNMISGSGSCRPCPVGTSLVGTCNTQTIPTTVGGPGGSATLTKTMYTQQCRSNQATETSCSSNPSCPSGSVQDTTSSPQPCEILPVIDETKGTSEISRYNSSGALKVKKVFQGKFTTPPPILNLIQVISYKGNNGVEKQTQKVVLLNKDGILRDNYILEYKEDGTNINTIHTFVYDPKDGNSVTIAEMAPSTAILEKSSKYAWTSGKTEQDITSNSLLAQIRDTSKGLEFIHYTTSQGPFNRPFQISRESRPDSDKWKTIFYLTPYTIRYDGGSGEILGTTLAGGSAIDRAQFKPNSPEIAYFDENTGWKIIGYYRIVNSSNFDLTDVNLNLKTDETLLYNYTIFGNERGKLDTLYFIGTKFNPITGKYCDPTTSICVDAGALAK